MKTQKNTQQQQRNYAKSQQKQQSISKRTRNSKRSIKLSSKAQNDQIKVNRNPFNVSQLSSKMTKKLAQSQRQFNRANENSKKKDDKDKDYQPYASRKSKGSSKSKSKVINEPKLKSIKIHDQVSPENSRGSRKSAQKRMKVQVGQKPIHNTTLTGNKKYQSQKSIYSRAMRQQHPEKSSILVKYEHESDSNKQAPFQQPMGRNKERKVQKALHKKKYIVKQKNYIPNKKIEIKKKQKENLKSHFLANLGGSSIQNQRNYTSQQFVQRSNSASSLSSNNSKKSKNVSKPKMVKKENQPKKENKPRKENQPRKKNQPKKENYIKKPQSLLSNQIQNELQFAQDSSKKMEYQMGNDGNFKFEQQQQNFLMQYQEYLYSKENKSQRQLAEWAPVLVKVLSLGWSGMSSPEETTDRIIEFYNKDKCKIFQCFVELSDLPKVMSRQIFKEPFYFVRFMKPEQKYCCFSFVFQFFVYNFDSIAMQHLKKVSDILYEWKRLSRQNSQMLNQRIYLNIAQHTVYIFRQLEQLKYSSSLQITKDKKSKFLLKYLYDHMVILQIWLGSMTSKQQILTGTWNQLVRTSYVLMLQFTGYLKINKLQRDSVSQKTLLEFFETTIEKVIFFNCLQAGKMGQGHINRINSAETQLNLPIFNWTVLSIKGQEKNIFKQIMDKCKTQLKKKITLQMIFKHKKRQNNTNTSSFKRYTIHEDVAEIDQQSQQCTQRRRSRKKSISVNSERLLQETNPQKQITSLLNPVFSHLNFLEFQQLNIKETHKRFHHLFDGSFSRNPTDSKIKRVQIPRNHIQKFLVIICFNGYLFSILEQIEYMDMSNVRPSVAKGIFKIANFSYDFRGIDSIKSILSQIEANPGHSILVNENLRQNIDFQRRTSKLFNQKHDNQDQNFVNSFSLKVCEDLLFEISCQIQKKICLFPLEHYLEEFILKPQIFRSQKYFVQLLQQKPLKEASTLFLRLIDFWIENQLRKFNILDYYRKFVSTCYKCDENLEMLYIIENLSEKKLCKLHLLLFKETFNQDSNQYSKLYFIQPRNQRFLLNSLTSVGYSDKSVLIDFHFPYISEVILWRNYLGNCCIGGLNNNFSEFILSKSYFYLVYQYFRRNRQNIVAVQLIQNATKELRVYIENGKVDEAASTFHLLSLALFPDTSNTDEEVPTNIPVHSQVKSQKSKKTSQQITITQMFQKTSNREYYSDLILNLLYVLRENSQAIISLYNQKESLTLKTLYQMNKDDKVHRNAEITQELRRNVQNSLKKSKLMHEYLLKNILQFFNLIKFNPRISSGISNPDKLIKVAFSIAVSSYKQKQQHSKGLSSKDMLSTHLTRHLSEMGASNDIFLQKFEEYWKGKNSFLNAQVLLLLIRQKIHKWIQSQSQINQQSIKDKNSMVSLNLIKSTTKQIDHKLTIEMINYCLQIVQIDIKKQSSYAESKIMKWKIQALEIMYTFSKFVKNLKARAKPTKSKSTNVNNHTVFAEYQRSLKNNFRKLLIRILLNDNNLLCSGYQRQTLIYIRTFVLRWLFQDQTARGKKLSDPLNDQYQSIVSNKEFWYIVFMLCLDKNIEVRFILLNLSISGFQTQSAKNIFNYPSHKLAICMLMSFYESFKSITSIVKSTLDRVRNSDKASRHLIAASIELIIFVNQFNTHFEFKSGMRKINQEPLFQMISDMFYDKNDLDNYAMAVLQHFSANSQKERLLRTNKILFTYQIQIDFLAMKYPVHSHHLHTIHSKGKEQAELLMEMQVQSLNKQNMGSNSKKKLKRLQGQKDLDSMYQRNFNNSIKLFKDVFNKRNKIAVKKSSKNRKGLKIIKSE